MKDSVCRGETCKEAGPARIASIRERPRYYCDATREVLVEKAKKVRNTSFDKVV